MKNHKIECNQYCKQFHTHYQNEFLTHQDTYYTIACKDDNAKNVLDAYRGKKISAMEAYYRLRLLEYHFDLELTEAFIAIISDDFPLPKFLILSRYIFSSTEIEEALENLNLYINAINAEKVNKKPFTLQKLEQDIPLIIETGEQYHIDELRQYVMMLEKISFAKIFHMALGKKTKSVDTIHNLSLATLGLVYEYEQDEIFRTIEQEIDENGVSLGVITNTIPVLKRITPPSTSSQNIVKKILNAFNDEQQNLKNYFISELHRYYLIDGASLSGRITHLKQLQTLPKAAKKNIDLGPMVLEEIDKRRLNELLNVEITAIKEPDLLARLLESMVNCAESSQRHEIKFVDLLSTFMHHFDDILKKMDKNEGIKFTDAIFELIDYNETELRAFIHYQHRRDNLTPDIKTLSQCIAEFYIRHDLAERLSERLIYSDEITPNIYNKIMFGSFKKGKSLESTLLQYAISKDAKSCINVITKMLNSDPGYISLAPLPLESTGDESAKPTDIDRFCQYLDTTLCEVTGFKLSEKTIPKQKNSPIKLIYTHETATPKLTTELIKELRKALSNVFMTKANKDKGQILQVTRKQGIQSISITIVQSYLNDWLQITSNKKLLGIFTTIKALNSKAIYESSTVTQMQVELSETDKQLIDARINTIALGSPYRLIDSNAHQITFEVDYRKNDSTAECLSKEKLKSLRQRLKRLGVETTANNGVSTFTFKAFNTSNDKTIFNDNDWDVVRNWLAGLSSKKIIVKQGLPQQDKVIASPKQENQDDNAIAIDYADIARDILSELIPENYLAAVIGAFVWPKELTLVKNKFIELPIKPGMKDIRLGNHRPIFADLLTFLAMYNGIIYFSKKQILSIHYQCSPCLESEKTQLHHNFDNWLKDKAIPEMHYERNRFFPAPPKILGPSDRLFELVTLYKDELDDNGFFDYLERLQYCEEQIKTILHHFDKDQHRLLQCFYKAYAYFLTMAIQRIFDVAGEAFNLQLDALRHSIRHMRHDSPNLSELRIKSRAILHASAIKVTQEDMQAFDELLANAQTDRAMQVSRNEAMTVIQAEFAFLEEAKAIGTVSCDKYIIQAAVEHSANFIFQIVKHHDLFHKIDRRIKAEIQAISQEMGHQNNVRRQSVG